MHILPAIEPIVGNQETCDENKLILNLMKKNKFNEYLESSSVVL